MTKKKLSDFPEIAAEFHLTRNGDITAEMIIAGSGKKHWWKCPKNHEWQASCDNRTGKKSGCPYCANQLVCEDNCLSTFPEIAAEFHPTKNGDLTADTVVAGSNKKYWWQCPKCHEWQATCNKRTGKKTGCPYCVNRLVCEDNCLSTLFPEIAAEFHPTKNGDLTATMVIAGSNNKYWWQCPKYHEWQTTCNIRTIQKTGCPYCANKLVCNDNCLSTLFPEIAAEFHPTKNGDLTATMVIAGSNNKYWWLGKCGHEWQASCVNRTDKKTGCPICKESKGEKAIREYLEMHNISFKSQYKFKKSKISKSPFDFAVNKGVIEYQGEQHYIPRSFGSKKEHGDIRVLIDAMKSDVNKKRWCEKHNIPLLEIPYWEKDRIPEILDAFLSGEEIQMLDPPEIVKEYELMRSKILERIENENNITYSTLS